VEAGGDCEIIGEKSFTAPNTAAIGAFPVSMVARRKTVTTVSRIVVCIFPRPIIIFAPY
jgi:hypothetical protein